MNTCSKGALDATQEKLVDEYDSAYVDHLEASECDDLEDRLTSALRLSDLANRMKAAGLEAHMREIHDAYRD